jgi:hypothetical protein
MKVPSREKLWGRVFGWRGGYIKEEVDKGRLGLGRLRGAEGVKPGGRCVPGCKTIDMPRVAGIIRQPRTQRPLVVH